MNGIKIDGKEYKYFLRREHVYLFGKIIGKLDININLQEVKTINDIVMMIRMIQNAVLNLETTDEESINFISSIYNLKPEEIREKEFHKFELKLWENLFKDKELVSFLSQVFRSKSKASQKKKT